MAAGLSKQRPAPEYLVAVAGVWMVAGAPIGILARLFPRRRDHRRHRDLPASP